MQKEETLDKMPGGGLEVDKFNLKKVLIDAGLAITAGASAFGLGMISHKNSNKKNSVLADNSTTVHETFDSAYTPVIHKSKFDEE